MQHSRTHACTYRGKRAESYLVVSEIQGTGGAVCAAFTYVLTSVKLVTMVVDVDPESWRLRLASVPIVTSEPALQSLARAEDIDMEDMNSARGLKGLDCCARPAGA